MRLRYPGTHLPGKRSRVMKPGTRYTLVLGGGGMKGLAHIGVLQALLERGLRPAQIVASSVDEVQVADAVMASCALPGYLPPHEIRGRYYIDGATVDNLPFGAARALDTELILAVDVSASSALRADTQDEGFAAVFARATELA